MNIEMSASLSPVKRMALEIIVDESQKILNDGVLFEYYSLRGRPLFDKQIKSELKVGDVIITPVSPLCITNLDFRQTYKEWAHIFLEDKLDCQTLKEDFAFLLGFFSVIVKIVDKDFTNDEIEHIIDSSLIFLKEVITEMTNQILEDLR